MKFTDQIRKSYAPKIAEFQKRHDRLRARTEARAAAEEAYRVAEAHIPELHNRRESLRGQYHDALFEEDQERAKDIQATRKTLDKDIAAATKDRDRKLKSFQSAEFPVFQEARAAFLEAQTEAHGIIHELTLLGEELTGPTGEMRTTGSTGFGGVIGELGSEVMAAVYSIDALARAAHDAPQNMAA